MQHHSKGIEPGSGDFTFGSVHQHWVCSQDAGCAGCNESRARCELLWQCPLQHNAEHLLDGELLPCWGHFLEHLLSSEAAAAKETPWESCC